MKHLYYVRHGQSAMNVSGHFAGHSDTPLTDMGRGQAKAAGQQAVELDINLIIASPLERALETAQIIADAVGYPRHAIQTNQLLIERDYGKTITGLPFDSDPDFESFPDFETDAQLLVRAQKVADWLNSLDVDTVLIASHGSLGWALRHIYDPAFNSPDEPLNAEIVRLL